MYVCIHTYMYMRICSRPRMNIHIYNIIHAYVHIHVYVHIYSRPRLNTHRYNIIYVYVNIYVYVRIQSIKHVEGKSYNAYTCIHVHAHKYKYSELLIKENKKKIQKSMYVAHKYIHTCCMSSILNEIYRYIQKNLNKHNTVQGA